MFGDGEFLVSDLSIDDDLTSSLSEAQNSNNFTQIINTNDHLCLILFLPIHASMVLVMNKAPHRGFSFIICMAK